MHNNGHDDELMMIMMMMMMMMMMLAMEMEMEMVMMMVIMNYHNNALLRTPRTSRAGPVLYAT